MVINKFFLFLFGFFILGIQIVYAEDLVKNATSAILIEPTTNSILYENQKKVKNMKYA